MYTFMQLLPHSRSLSILLFFQRTRFCFCLRSLHVYTVFLCLLLFIIWFYYMVPSKHMRDDLFPASPLTSGGLLATCGVPGLVGVSPRPLLSCSYASFLCVCLLLLPLGKHSKRPYCNLITSVKTLSSKKFTFWDTGAPDLYIWLLEGHNSTCNGDSVNRQLNWVQNPES